MAKTKYYFLGMLLFFLDIANAQTPIDSLGAGRFEISPRKALGKPEIDSKKAGIDKDILPQLGYDNLTGINYGVVGSLFNNGQKTDPLFYYSDYRFRLDFALGGSYKDQQSGFAAGDNQVYLKFDAPYLFGSRYHLSGDINIESNPYNLYYGVNTNSLSPLRVLTNNDPLYNYFKQNEKSINLNLEKMYCKGFLWAYVGIGYSDEDISALPLSLLAKDGFLNSVEGIGHSKVAALRIGIRYDSRNHPDNPDQGLVIEITKEQAIKFDELFFRFNRTFFHFNYYSKLNHLFKPHKSDYLNSGVLESGTDMFKVNKIGINHNLFKESVFAFRYAFGTVNGAAPFYAYQNFWSSESNLQILGGDDNLRGYPPSRFAGKVTSFLDFECRTAILRYQHVETKKASTVSQEDGFDPKSNNHHGSLAKSVFYEFGLVPFIDLGGVWDNITGYLNQFKNYRTSFGLGARLIINSNFVLRYDYAISKESQYSMFGLAQTF